VIRFETPWLLLLVVALPIVLLVRGRRPDTRPAAVLWGALEGLRPPGAGAFLLGLARGLPWIALLLALVALARPQQGLQQSEVDSRGVDIMLAIDISRSMSATDMGGGRRLDLARETAREFVKGRPHDRIGVVAFAGTAFSLCPLTLDHETLNELVSGLDFGLVEDGTAIGMGLATAVQRLHDAATPSKVVVLLTDGDNNRGVIDPLTAADLARALGVRVYTVLVGRPTVVAVPSDDPALGRVNIMKEIDTNPEQLQEIAQRTGGRFFRAEDAVTLSGIYSEIDRLERAPIHAVVYRQYRDLGPLVLGAAGALLALGMALGSTLGLRTP